MPTLPTLLVLNNTPRADVRPEIVDRFAGDQWRVETRWAAGGEFPEAPGDYDAIYLSGSPHGAYEAIDWISTEHVLIEQAAAKGTPMFGVCFGSQILASALCGREQVFRRPDCEVGHLWLDISEEARRDPLCAGLGPRLRMFVWHNDEVRHDHDEVVVLGATPDCPNQMWRHRSLPAWGVQGHLEITRAEAPGWFERNRIRLEKDGADVDALIAEADDAADAKTMLQEFLRFSRRRALDIGISRKDSGRVTASAITRRERPAGEAALPPESISGCRMMQTSESATAAASRLPSLTEPWFPPDEHAERLARVQTEIASRGLDGILLFQPESVTWLTGFFTRGYTSFQFVAVPASGDPVVCCRDVEGWYLERTATYREHVAWTDTDDPMRVGAEMVRGLMGPDARLGVELAAWPLSAAHYRALGSALPGTAFEDASDVVRSLRFVKSPRELAFMTRAAHCAEAGMAAAAEAAQPGTSERELAAAVCDAMIRVGSDIPGPGVLSSGEGALHLHGSYTDRILSVGDTVQLETIPCVRHYHARFMRPLKVARASRDELTFADRLVAIQDEALATVAPGVPATIPDRIYRSRLLGEGLVEHYTNKTFYSVGLLLPPSGGEALEASPTAEWRFRAGMTFHTYLLARGFGLSETIVITETGYQRLTKFPRRLIVTSP